MEQGDPLIDIPTEILRVVLIDKYNDKMDKNNWKCLIRWKKRINGSYPLSSFLNYNEVKQRYPGLLLNLYESRADIIDND